MAIAAFLNLRKHSLLRGTLLVLGSLTLAFLLSDFPNNRPSLELLLPTLAGFLGTLETGRCLRMHWSFYHGAVVVLLYADILAMLMILFLLLYPYTQWLV